MLGTVDLEDIKSGYELYPVCGVALSPFEILVSK